MVLTALNLKNRRVSAFVPEKKEALTVFNRKNSGVIGVELAK